MQDRKIETLKNLSIRVDALRRAMETVMAGSTPDHAKWVGFKNYTRTYSNLAQQYIAASGDNTVPLYDAEKLKGAMDTLWPVQKEIFETVYTATLTLSGILAQFDVGASASVSEIQDLLVANLRKVIFSKPEREVDVQNAIETLLIGRGYQKGVHYDREAGKLKFSGKEFVPDFIFRGFNAALEVKLIRERAHISQCIEEMSADIPAYLSAYGSVIFCVYDLGEIRDVSEFQEGIQKQKNVRISVVKH